MGRPRKNPIVPSVDTPVVEQDETRLTPEVEEEVERLTPPEQKAPVMQEEVDYLRKYQYRKQTVRGSVESDPVPGSKAERQKERLLTQPKVSIMIPREQGEDKSILHPVTLNGYRLDLPKQTYVVVPEQVADVIKESLNQTEQALSMNRIDGNKAREGALL
jgi:hypothetical protein